MRKVFANCIQQISYFDYIVPVLKLNGYFEWNVQEKLNGGKIQTFAFLFLCTDVRLVVELFLVAKFTPVS